MSTKTVKTITIWLPVSLIDAVKEEALEIHVPYKRLMRLYIQNGLEGKYGE
ncbi:MAG: CopG family antitoxin [Ktedonobacteraceae bacterium]